MKKPTQKPKKLHTRLEKIRALVTDQLTNVNGGGTEPKHDNNDTTDYTGCTCRTI